MSSGMEGVNTRSGGAAAGPDESDVTMGAGGGAAAAPLSGVVTRSKSRAVALAATGRAAASTPAGGGADALGEVEMGVGPPGGGAAAAPAVAIDSDALKLMDTFHDFGKGPRAGLMLSPPEKNTFELQLYKALHRAIPPPGMPLPVPIIPDFSALYARLDPLINANDIEDSAIERYETRYPFLGSVTQGNTLTYDVILKNVVVPPTPASLAALNPYRQWPILHIKPGKIPVETLIEKSSVTPSPAAIANRQKLAIFILYYFFGKDAVDKRSYITFDGSPGISAKILSSYEPVRALSIPQNITDSANTSFTQFDTQPNVFMYPYGIDADTNNPVSKDAYIATQNLYTRGRYRMAYMNKGFTALTPTHFDYVIQHVSGNGIRIPYERYKQGAPVNYLIQCVNALASGGDLRTIPTGSASVVPLGAFIQENAAIRTDLSNNNGDLFFDEKRSGDENQVMGLKRLHANYPTIRAVLGTADRPCFLKARIEKVPAIYQNFALDEMTLAKPYIDPTPASMVALQIAEFEDMYDRADFLFKNWARIRAMLLEISGEIGKLPLDIKYAFVMDLHESKKEDMQRTIARLIAFGDMFVLDASKLLPLPAGAGSLEKAKQGVKLQGAYAASVKVHDIDDSAYDTLTSDSVFETNQEDLIATLTRYTPALFTRLENKLTGIQSTLGSNVVTRSARIVNYADRYMDVLSAFDAIFRTYTGEVPPAIRAAILPDQAIVGQDIVGAKQEEIAMAIKTEIARVVSVLTTPLPVPMKGGARRDLVAGDIAAFVRAAEPAALFVNEIVTALNPFSTAAFLISQLLRVEDEIERANLKQQLVYELTTLYKSYPDILADYTKLPTNQVKYEYLIHRSTPMDKPAYIQQLRDTLEENPRTEAILAECIALWNEGIGSEVAGVDATFIDQFLRPLNYVPDTYKKGGAPYRYDNIVTLSPDGKTHLVNPYLPAHIVLILSLIYGRHTSYSALIPLLASFGLPKRIITEKFTTWIQIKNFITIFANILPNNITAIPAELKGLMGGARKTRRHKKAKHLDRRVSRRRNRRTRRD